MQPVLLMGLSLRLVLPQQGGGTRDPTFTSALLTWLLSVVKNQHLAMGASNRHSAGAWPEPAHRR